MKTKFKEWLRFRITQFGDGLNRKVNQLSRWQKIIALILFIGIGGAFFLHRMIRSPGKKGMEWSEISVPRLPTDSVAVEKK